jgi:hypothetical protein
MKFNESDGENDFGNFSEMSAATIFHRVLTGAFGKWSIARSIESVCKDLVSVKCDHIPDEHFRKKIVQVSMVYHIVTYRLIFASTVTSQTSTF